MGNETKTPCLCLPGAYSLAGEGENWTDDWRWGKVGEGVGIHSNFPRGLTEPNPGNQEGWVQSRRRKGRQNYKLKVKMWKREHVFVVDRGQEAR